MQIRIVDVGVLHTNCYLLIKDNKCLLIDPGDEVDKIKKAIGNLEVLAILITHHHFDHVLALDKLNNDLNVKVYDIYNVKRNMEIGPFKFKTIETKGHKEDSLTYYFEEEKAMFVGDFIFKGCIGRCDLEGGNQEEMSKSLEIIKNYDNDITLYPGHGECTTLGYEKKNNPYF